MDPRADDEKNEGIREARKAVSLKESLSYPRRTVVAGGYGKTCNQDELEYEKHLQELENQEKAMRAIGNAIYVKNYKQIPSLNFNINAVSYIRNKDGNPEAHMIVALSLDRNLFSAEELQHAPGVSDYQRNYGVTIHFIRSPEPTEVRRLGNNENSLGYAKIRQDVPITILQSMPSHENLEQRGINQYSFVVVPGNTRHGKHAQLFYRDKDDQQRPVLTQINIDAASIKTKNPDTPAAKAADLQSRLDRMLSSNTKKLTENQQSKLCELIGEITSHQTDSAKRNVCLYKCCEPVSAALLEQKIDEAKADGSELSDIQENNFKYNSKKGVMELQNACSACEAAFKVFDNGAPGNRPDLLNFPVTAVTASPPGKIQEEKEEVRVNTGTAIAEVIAGTNTVTSPSPSSLADKNEASASQPPSASSQVSSQKAQKRNQSGAQAASDGGEGNKVEAPTPSSSSPQESSQEIQGKTQKKNATNRITTIRSAKSSRWRRGKQSRYIIKEKKKNKRADTRNTKVSK